MNSDRISKTVLMIEAMNSGASLDELLKKSEPLKPLPELILPRLRDMSYDTLGVLVGSSRANIYKMMSGKSHPEKDMLLRIAFVLHMSLDETQQMLKSAHRTPLSSGSQRDVCVMYGLMNHLEGDEMDSVLQRRGMDPLWPDEE
jgi:hypothetical protein